MAEKTAITKTALSVNDSAALDILSQIKILLDLTEDNAQRDAVLTLMIKDAITAALCYCHRVCVTPPMTVAIRGMVLRRYAAENGDGTVASVKRGDTTVTYANVISADGLTAQEMVILNAFRRVIAR